RTSRCPPPCPPPGGGIAGTSGCEPVAIEERQTGVSDGKVDVARRYVPCSARNLIAGVSAASNIDGVRPSMTTRTTGFNRARGRAALRGCRVTGGADVRRAEALRAPPGGRGRARTHAPHRRVRRGRAGRRCPRAGRRGGAGGRAAAPPRRGGAPPPRSDLRRACRRRRRRAHRLPPPTRRR